MNYPPSVEHRNQGSFKTDIYCHAPDEIFDPPTIMTADMMLDIISGKIAVPCQLTGVITPTCGLCGYVKMTVVAISDTTRWGNM
jgi:hypothetical protein